MISGRNALASGPGNRGSFKISYERFAAFQALVFAGGHEYRPVGSQTPLRV
jgi:hypothetical protein